MMNSNYQVSKHSQRALSKILEITEAQNLNSERTQRLNRYLRTQLRRAFDRGIDSQGSQTTCTGPTLAQIS